MDLQGVSVSQMFRLQAALKLQINLWKSVSAAGKTIALRFRSQHFRLLSPNLDLPTETSEKGILNFELLSLNFKITPKFVDGKKCLCGVFSQWRKSHNFTV